MSEEKTETGIWNLPNKLTTLRVILIVPFVLLLLGSCREWDALRGLFGDGYRAVCEWIALAIFIVASLTDLLDGKIARKYHLVTNFGKFMDPLADKLLVCAALVLLVEMGRIPSWIVIVIISRELIISGFREIAADNGVVIAASYFGKFKTTFQMVTICLMLVQDAPLWQALGIEKGYLLLTAVLMWAALLLTVVSLVDYLVKNKNVILETKK